MSKTIAISDLPATSEMAVMRRASESESAIRQQLTRMLENRIFVHSERLSRFLRFIVEHVLAGNQNQLKEYVIGSEVYDRRPPYHPSQDSIVRTEARRLRSKLKEYYETEGKEDTVYFYLRPGSYVPVFQDKATLAGTAALGSPADGIAIAIQPFRDISQSPLSGRFARGIPDELAYILMRTPGCRVISPSSGAQIAFEGSVRQEDDCIRVTGRIVDAAGFHLWTTRVDAPAGMDAMFLIEEQIASALSAGFHALSAVGLRAGSTRHAMQLSPVSLSL